MNTPAFPTGGTNPTILVILTEATAEQCGAVVTYSYDVSRTDQCERSTVLTTAGVVGSPIIVAEQLD
jgi:hypothetical protein